MLVVVEGAWCFGVEVYFSLGKWVVPCHLKQPLLFHYLLPPIAPDDESILSLIHGALSVPLQLNLFCFSAATLMSREEEHFHSLFRSFSK